MQGTQTLSRVVGRTTRIRKKKLIYVPAKNEEISVKSNGVKNVIDFFSFDTTNQENRSVMDFLR